MISQTAEYALRAVIYLAECGEAQTIQQIATVTRTPGSYLSKVMQSLGRAGIVSSQRGLHGGFALRVPAQQLSLYEIIQAVDPMPRITSCPLALEAHATQLCELHCRLDAALAEVERQFRETTVAEILTRPIFRDALTPTQPLTLSMKLT